MATDKELSATMDSKERRRAANRRSARKSRYRQLVMLEELQKSLNGLQARNSQLKQENAAIRNQVQMLKSAFERDSFLPTNDHLLPLVTHVDPMGEASLIDARKILAQLCSSNQMPTHLANPNQLANPIPNQLHGQISSQLNSYIPSRVMEEMFSGNPVLPSMLSDRASLSTR